MGKKRFPQQDCRGKG